MLLDLVEVRTPGFCVIFGIEVLISLIMDAVGLDTVEFIEEHYIKERGLSGENTTEYLKKNYIDQGKLGAKIGKGGLYPAGYTTKAKAEDSHNHDNLHAPSLSVSYKLIRNILTSIDS